MSKMPKFHPIYQSESLCKADSRNKCFAKSAGTIFRFQFFNPVLKNTKSRQDFVKLGDKFFVQKYC